MKKYRTVFQLSFQNEFVYRLNFILWRFRNVLRMLMTYFLWNSIFSQNHLAFGYSRDQIMAYIFLVLIVSSFVIAAPSNDNIGGEISSGDLSNYLTKPINYLRYWLTRDWASKLLNIIFAVLEITLLWAIFRPQIYLSSSPLIITLGLTSIVFAAILYFLVTKLAVLIAFWAPENTWSLMFVVMVFFEILSGATFPLNILPDQIYTLISYTPFPYLVYFPVSILVGKFTPQETIPILIYSLAWILISAFLVHKIWRAGLKAYSAYGK